MAKENKIVTIALSLVCGMLVIATTAFYVMEEGEKSKKNSLQKRLDEMTAVRKDYETKLKDSEILSEELKSRLKTQEDAISAMTQQIESVKAENSRNITSVQDKTNELRALGQKLDAEKAEKDNIAKQLQKTNEDYLSAKFQLENLLKSKEEIDRKARELAEKEGVSLGTIVVKEPSK